LYKYFTFASASWGLCPPGPLPELCPWIPLGDLHPADPRARPPFGQYLDPHVNPSVVESWVRLWLVQIWHRECITTHLAAHTKLLRQAKTWTARHCTQ